MTIDRTPIFVQKNRKILFLREVIDKIVFSSLIVVNGILTILISHCDNHYHVTFGNTDVSKMSIDVYPNAVSIIRFIHNFTRFFTYLRRL